MKVFYDQYYNMHIGFKYSLECCGRITNTIKNIGCEQIGFVRSLPVGWNKIIDNMEQKYNSINKINCQVCSYLNEKDESRCEICNSTLGTVKIVSPIDGDTTYMCKDSSKTVTGILNTIMNTLDWQTDEKNTENVFIMCRPPGHHSDNITPSGFCIVNNMYMAVDYLRNFKKKNKIAIIDWDVHHGNGTQKLFYNDKNTLFIDIHRENFYPFTGSVEERGDGDGFGYTINIPLQSGSDENIYVEKFNSIIIPMLKTFEPEWIMISCGFDAHIRDPCGGMKLTSTSYGIFHQLLKSFNKPMTYILEGGYDTEAITSSVSEILRYDLNTTI